MKRRNLLLCFSLMAFTAAAAAGDSGSSQQSSSGGSSSMQSQAQHQSRNALPVSQLKDMKVVSAQGEDVGSISDVVLNLANQRVQAVVLESGGWFGIGGDNYAFRMSDFKRGQQKDQLVLKVDKQKLDQKQGFKKEQWPGMGDKYWTQTGSGAAAGGTQQGPGGRMDLIRASELQGQQVQDKSGQQVGEVKNVVVGLNDGRIHSLTLDLDDGGQARIPAKQLSRGTDDRLVVAMDAQQIRSHQKQSRGNRNAGGGNSSSGSSGQQQQQKQ